MIFEANFQVFMV